MDAAPLTVDFLFVCTFECALGPSMPVCMRVLVCAFVGACTLCSAWKGKRMRANWVSQEAGLESDLISLMCDQCEWEAGTRKASVATQLRLLHMRPRPQTHRRDTTRGFQKCSHEGSIKLAKGRGSSLIFKRRSNTYFLSDGSERCLILH